MRCTVAMRMPTLKFQIYLSDCSCCQKTSPLSWAEALVSC